VHAYENPHTHSFTIVAVILTLSSTELYMYKVFFFKKRKKEEADLINKIHYGLY
jgi:hypothetical protein